MMTGGQDAQMGGAFMDTEHRDLHRILDDLGEAVETRQNRARLDELLEQLTGELRDHFAHEELQMRERGYPWVSAHTAAHTVFLDELEGLWVRHERGQVVLAVGVMEFVRTWFLRHVQDSDKPLGDWLAATVR